MLRTSLTLTRAVDTAPVPPELLVERVTDRTESTKVWLESEHCWSWRGRCGVHILRHRQLRLHNSKPGQVQYSHSQQQLWHNRVRGHTDVNGDSSRSRCGDRRVLCCRQLRTRKQHSQPVRHAELCDGCGSWNAGEGSA